MVISAHTLADNGDHTQADGLSRDIDKAGDRTGDRVSGDGGAAHRQVHTDVEGGNQAQDEELTDLEHTVFDTGRHADAEDSSDHAPLEARVQDTFHIDWASRSGNQEEDNEGAGDTGDEGTDTGPGGAQVKTEDQHGVHADINQVNDQGIEHRYFTIAHSAEEGGACVVQRDKGVSGRREHEVDEGGVHSFLGDTAEEEPEDMFTKEECGGHKREGGQQGDIEELFGGRARVFGFLTAEELGHDDRAAGRQSGKDIDEEDIDVVDQGDA